MGSPSKTFSSAQRLTRGMMRLERIECGGTHTSLPVLSIFRSMGQFVFACLKCGAIFESATSQLHAPQLTRLRPLSKLRSLVNSPSSLYHHPTYDLLPTQSCFVRHVLLSREAIIRLQGHPRLSRLQALQPIHQTTSQTRISDLYYQARTALSITFRAIRS